MTPDFLHTFIQHLINLKRGHKRLLMLLADLCALPLALWSGYALRLSEWWPYSYLFAGQWLFVCVPLFGVFVFMRLGLYRAVVRFMGAQALWAVTKGVLLLAIALWFLAAVLDVQPFPRSVPIIFALSALVYVGGSRLLVRYYYHWILKHYVNKDAVLIFGAGGAGIQLATALSDGKEYFPVGFVDDDQSLWRSTIKNLPVYQPAELKKVIEQHDVKHVLLAIPNACNRERKSILERLDGLNVHVQTIPSMPDLLSGQASIEQLRDVQIEDLLGRDPVPPMPSLMVKCINEKVVMITGAGGSIGSELCRQVIQQNPTCMVLLERCEYNLYCIEQELLLWLEKQNKNIPVYPILGSVTNRQRVASIIRRFAVSTIYHAAAYKHVPLVEHNVVEGVNNNIVGTQIVADEANSAGVKHFILISTDKAVRPTNVMGATKRFAELILQDLSVHNPTTIFSMVRFGNVLDSSGSVVPLFRQQIQNGGPVTVTHKDITRFFMTIPEAASLVIQAGSMAEGGDVFVLDMDEPVKIDHLARRIIQLSGLEVKSQDNPDGDIEIKYTGLRPAEKLYEELLVGENVVGTLHPKIMRASESLLPEGALKKYLDDMRLACNDNDSALIKSLLQESVCGYQPHDILVDHVSQATPKAPDNDSDNVVRLR